MKKLSKFKAMATLWIQDQDNVVQPFYESLHGGTEIR